MAAAHVTEVCKYDGFQAAFALIGFLEDAGIKPQSFEDFCTIGNGAIAAWHEGFMSKWMPWMAGQLSPPN